MVTEIPFRYVLSKWAEQLFRDPAVWSGAAQCGMEIAPPQEGEAGGGTPGPFPDLGSEAAGAQLAWPSLPLPCTTDASAHQGTELPDLPLSQSCSESKASRCPASRASPSTRPEWSPPR